MSAAEWARTVWRHARRAGVIAIGVLAAGIVMSLTVDLAGLVPAVTLGRVDLRRSAERALGKRLDRTVTIGGLSLRVFDGRFIVSDLAIDGLDADGRAVLRRPAKSSSTCRSGRLLRRELNIVSVEMTDWRMTVETFPGGRHSFPRFQRRPSRPGHEPDQGLGDLRAHAARASSSSRTTARRGARSCGTSTSRSSSWSATAATRPRRAAR